MEDEKEHDVPFIRPSANPHSSLRLDEVQHGLQGAAAISQNKQSETWLASAEAAAAHTATAARIAYCTSQRRALLFLLSPFDFSLPPL